MRNKNLDQTTYLAEFDDGGAFTKGIGCRILSASFERAEGELVIEPARHLNSAGVVHGGVYLALADVTAAAAANADGQRRLTASGSFEIFGGATKGTLHAVATLLSASRRLAYHEVRITDDLGRLLFRQTAQGYCVGQPP